MVESAHKCLIHGYQTQLFKAIEKTLQNLDGISSKALEEPEHWRSIREQLGRQLEIFKSVLEILEG